MDKTASENPIEIMDLDAFNSADEAEMIVVLNGRPTTWVWRFAGPGHQKTVEQATKQARDLLHRQRDQENARVNNRKWRAPEESPDEVRGRNVAFVVERLLGWSQVKVNGEDFPFSTTAATELLLDRRKDTLLSQAIEFLADTQSFIKRSATS